ncbi:hypothetical protein HPB48_006989 [Haemaphysalis longicornis]|uniref:Uncharacterized protein n=1 Tax=Haemaphysalis longicornis TaxID=44386 RepID=A0A9J6GX61_HAELO|nr:hypothetical protein HPB48_006989 [Haemaphysalis longicornis]
MLALLSSPAVEALLKFFNKIWVLGKIAESWKKAFILAFLKPGKLLNWRSRYRPIPLSSCLAKTYVRIIKISFLLQIGSCGLGGCASDMIHRLTPFVFLMQVRTREPLL